MGKGRKQKLIDPKIPTTSSHNVVREGFWFIQVIPLVRSGIRVNRPKTGKSFLVFRQMSNRQSAEPWGFWNDLFVTKIFVLLKGYNSSYGPKRTIPCAAIVFGWPRGKLLLKHMFCINSWVFGFAFLTRMLPSSSSGTMVRHQFVRIGVELSGNCSARRVSPMFSRSNNRFRRQGLSFTRNL